MISIPHNQGKTLIQHSNKQKQQRLHHCSRQLPAKPGVIRDNAAREKKDAKEEMFLRLIYNAFLDIKKKKNNLEHAETKINVFLILTLLDNKNESM